MAVSGELRIPGLGRDCEGGPMQPMIL